MLTPSPLPAVIVLFQTTETILKSNHSIKSSSKLPLSGVVEITNYCSFSHTIVGGITTKPATVTGVVSCIMQELDGCKKDLICHQALIGAKTQLMIVKWGMIAPS